MATVNGNEVETFLNRGESLTGRYVFWPGYEAQLGGAEATTAYKMQAVDPTETSGYATWINNTGDEAGKPGTATGIAVQVASWAV